MVCTLLAITSYNYINLLHSLQCLMPMEILFDVGGLSHLKMSVLMCARFSQLHLTRLAMCVTVNNDTHKLAFLQ